MAQAQKYNVSSAPVALEQPLDGELCMTDDRAAV